MQAPMQGKTRSLLNEYSNATAMQIGTAEKWWTQCITKFVQTKIFVMVKKTFGPEFSFRYKQHL